MGNNEEKSPERGLTWGFADPCEAIAYPLTKELKNIWFAQWQCGAVINEEETWLEHLRFEDTDGTENSKI